MPTKRISQREARRLRQRVADLERRERRRREVWCGDWFGGTDVGRVTVSADTYAALHTARRLSHALVAVTDNNNVVRFLALPHHADGRI